MCEPFQKRSWAVFDWNLINTEQTSFLPIPFSLRDITFVISDLSYFLPTMLHNKPKTINVAFVAWFSTNYVSCMKQKKTTNTVFRKAKSESKYCTLKPQVFSITESFLAQSTHRSVALPSVCYYSRAQNEYGGYLSGSSRIL